MADCVLSIHIGLLIPMGWALYWVTSTSVIQRKDDFISGTRHSPMATRERLHCFISFFFPHVLEIAQPDYTRRDSTALGIIRTLSRIDRIIINLPMAEARDFHCYSHVFENLGNRTIPSDHAALRLVIQKPTNRGQQGNRIPRWMTKHPVFCSILKRLHDNHRFSANPFGALAEFKVLLKASKQTIRELSRKTLDSIGAKLFVACTALRAYRNRHLGTLMRCCEAWKPIENCFDTSSFECFDFQRFCQIIANLTRETLEEREVETTNLPWTQTGKILSQAQIWATCLSPTAVTDADGGEPFSKHVWKAPDITSTKIFCDMSNRLLMTNVGLNKAEFDDLLAMKNDSAPGLDGIPYGAYRCDGGLGSQFLFLFTGFCWEEEPFLNISLKVELSLSPRPMTSMTMEGSFDLLTLIAR